MFAADVSFAQNALPGKPVGGPVKILKDGVSLAFDPKEKLQAFAKKTVFKYAIAPVKKSYMEKELGVKGYPTRYVVNKQGFIAKVVGNPDELAVALKTEAAT